jgi:hypothetical protein
MGGAAGWLGLGRLCSSVPFGSYDVMPPNTILPVTYSPAIAYFALTSQETIDKGLSSISMFYSQVPSRNRSGG